MRRTAILWDRLGREDKEIKTIKISWLGTRLRKNLIKLVAVMIIALMAIPVLPAKAQPAYLPGVHVGDSVTFGDVSGNVLNFNVTSSIVETVTSVSGTTVLFTLVFNYRNGTSQTVSASSDVLNLNGQFSFLIIAGGLSAGDSIIPSTSTSSSPGAITESVQRIYAGAVRPINEFSFTNPQPGQVSSVAAYWDASTGFLLEISEIFTQSSLSQNVLHLKATSTNVWAPSTSQDFAFDAIPLTSPLVYLGQTAEFVLNLTSFQGFSGPVSLSASLTNSSLAHSPTLTLGALSVNVPTGGSATTTLGFSTNASTQLGVYLFSVHGVSGSIAHDARFAVFIVPPSFALISTPENLTIAGGSTASSTITARSLGLFSGSVSLAVYSGNPSITGILTPTNVFLSTSITSANSTLTVSAAPYAIPGDNSITVSGTSGQSQQSVTIPVSVSGPHFQLSLNTTSLTLSPGTAAAVSVNLKSISGFSGLIGLTDSSYGPAAISLNPTDIFLSSGGSASALLTVFVAPGATQGSSVYIDITGISGLLQQQASLFISIPGTSSSFFINANPFNLILKPGQNGNFTISLTSNGGFTGHIALAAQINGNPLGYVFSSTNVTLPPGGTATSTLTVSAPTSFSQGSSNINVYANSGNQSQSVFLYVNLGTPPSSGPDFGISASPNNLFLGAGSSGNSTITATSFNGFVGNLSLNASVLFGPTCPGPTCPTVSLAQRSLKLSSNGSNSTILYLTVPPGAPPSSNYFVEVTATNGTLNRVIGVGLTVCPCPSFQVAFNTNSLTVIRGTTVTPTLVVSSLRGFTGTVSLREVLDGGCYNNPACPAVSLSPASVFVPANGTATSTLTIATNPSTGTYYHNVEVIANSTLETEYASLYFNVVSLPRPDFAFFSLPNTLILTPGSSAPVSILLTSVNGFSGKISLSSNGLSPGLKISPNSFNLTLPASSSVSSTLTVSADVNAQPGSDYVQLIAISGNLTQYFYMSVIVAAPDFGTVVSQDSFTVQAGASPASTVLTIPSLDGLQGVVSLKATVQPCYNGVCPAVSFSPPNPSLSPGGWTLSNLTVTAPIGTLPGSYSIVVNATSGSVIHLLYLTVNVNPSNIQFPDFSVFASPSFLTIAQGGSVSSTITVESVNGFKGTVSLSSNANPGITPSLGSQNLALTPGGTNATRLDVSVPSTTPTGFYSLRVTGSNGTLSRSADISIQVVGPDFSVEAKPNLVTVPQGKSTTSSITLTSLAGFAGTVYLSASSNLPVSFSTSSVTLSPGETAFANLTINGFTNYPGYYYVYVTAFSGTVSHYVTITANVTGPDFTISASPANLTIEEGASKFSTITLKGFEGFSGPILLSASSYSYYYYYGNIQTSINPTTVTLNSTVNTATASLNVTIPVSTVPGSFNYAIVTGTNGILTHTIYIPVVVTGPDFTISASPYFINVEQGHNATSTISLSSVEGFHGTVNLSANSYGLTFTLNSTATVSSGGTATAILAVSTTSTTTLGSHFVSVSGTSGILSHSLYVNVNVTGPDFSIHASPITFTLMRGQNANSTITLHSIDGFTGSVGLAIASYGPTSSLSTSNVTLSPTTSGSATLSISVNSTFPNGYYQIAVIGTSGLLSHVTYLYVNVVGPDFSTSVYPYFFSLQPGQTVESIVSLTSFNGFSGNVTVSVSPGGLAASLGKTSLILGSGQTSSTNLTITVPAEIAPGTYYVTVQAVNGSIVRSATVYVYVFVITPDFSLTVIPYSQTLLAGTTGYYSVILTSSSGFSGTVSLNATLTNGITAAFSPQSLVLPAGGQVSANLAANIPANTLSGTYTIIVTATNTSGTPAHAAYVYANVLAQNFTLSATPTFLTIQAGSTGNSIITAIPSNGFTGTVNLALASNSQQVIPSLVTTSLEITSGLANSTELTVSTDSTTAPGFYQVTVNGTIGSLSRIITITVDVTPSQIQPTATTLTCATPVESGVAGTCAATVMSVAASGVTTPSGIVEFTTNSTGTFSPSYCYLSGTGTTGIASCTVEYTPNVIGNAQITGTYTGDTAHMHSSGNFTLTSLPNVSVQISGPTFGYTGSTVVFNAVASGGVPPYTLAWTSAGGSPSTGSGASFSTTYNTTGVFIVTATATDADGNTGSSIANILIFPTGVKLHLTVQVSNSTGGPIQGATILAESTLTSGTNSSVTDATGSTTLTLAASIYRVTASSPNYLNSTQIVDLVSDESITLTLANPFVYLGQIPGSHLAIQQVNGGFNITLTNMFANSQSDVFLDWKFLGTIPAGSTLHIFSDHLPDLIVESASKGTGDYPDAWYALPLPPGLNATTGQEGAFLPEPNPYNASSIFIIPNPPVPGQNTQIGVILHNPFNYTLSISRIDFQVATLNIGASTWSSVGQISNVTLAVGETRTFSVNWVATLASHLCVKVVLLYSSGGKQTLQKNFVISNSKTVPFIIGNPFATGGYVTITGGGGACGLYINGVLVTGTVVIYLGPGGVVYAIASGNCNVGGSIGGVSIGGIVTFSNTVPDVSIICPPDGFVGIPVTCSANPSGDISAYTFLWSTDGVPSTGTDSIFTTVYSIPGLHTVTVTLTSGGQSVTKSAQIMIFANAVTVGSSVVLSSPGVTGSSAYDTATITSPNATGPIPSGNLRYDFYSTSDCSGTPTSETVGLKSDGSVPNSSSTGPPGAGDYSFKANYLGDSVYQSASSDCESFIVNKAPTTVSTGPVNEGTGTAPSGDEIIGATFHDTATLKGTVSGFTPTGSVTYTFFNTKDCTGLSALEDVSLSADGSAPDSTSTGPLHAGNYSFTSTYNGDANYLKSPASSCEPLVVHRAPTTVTTQVVSDTTGLIPFGTEVTGASFHDSADLKGAVSGFIPSGTVTYSLYATSTCSGIPAKPVYAAILTAVGDLPDSISTSGLGAGTYSYNATYSGDKDYLPSTLGSCESLTVLQAPTTVTTSLVSAATGGAPSGTEVTGSSFSDKATLHGAIVGFTPGGNAQYRFWTNGTCTGTATAQTVDLTATGGVPGSSSTRPLGAGSYSFQADYSGDDNYLPSISSCEQVTVLKAPTTTSSQVINSATGLAPSGGEVAGTSFYDTATISGVQGFNPTGTDKYEFFTNTGCNGTPTTATLTLSSGLVPNSATTGPLGAGTYGYMTVYSGDGNYTGSSSPTCESFTVSKITPRLTTILTPTGPVKAGQTVTDKASFVPNTTFNPTGTVTYRLTSSATCSGTGAIVSSVTLSGGAIPGSGNVLLTTAGTFGFNATYNGDSNNHASTSSCEVITVNKATPSITTTLSTSTLNVQSSAFDSATLSTSSGSSAAGTVTYNLFTNGAGGGTGGCTGTSNPVSIIQVTNGVAASSRSVSFNHTGTFGWNAVYSGDANNLGATSSCELLSVVTPARPPGTPFFTLTVVPSSVQVNGGVLGKSIIVLRGFNGLARPISLSFTVSPSSGLLCTLTPTRITGGLGNSTLSCSGSTGVYTVTVTGSGGPLRRSVTVQFNITSTFGPLGCATGCSAFVLSDAILSAFSSNSSSISFTATGKAGTSAFANITIPVSAVPDTSALQVFINGTLVPSIVTSNSTDYFVYFSFTYHSVFVINIQLTGPAVSTTPVSTLSNPPSGGTTGILTRHGHGHGAPE